MQTVVMDHWDFDKIDSKVYSGVEFNKSKALGYHSLVDLILIKGSEVCIVFNVSSFVYAYSEITGDTKCV